MNNIKREVLKGVILDLCKVPQTVYYSEPISHAQIEAITRAVFDLQNIDWSDKKAIEEKRIKEYLERVELYRMFPEYMGKT